MKTTVVSLVIVLAVTLITLDVGQCQSAEPSLSQSPLRIDLDRYLVSRNSSVHLAFSEDDTMICVWWWAHSRPGDYLKDPVDYVIFTLKGELVSSSQGKPDLQNELVKKFPTISWRFHHRDFVQDATAWTFTESHSRAFRILPTSSDPLQCTVLAELWSFSPKPELSWQRQLTRVLPGYRFAAFIHGTGHTNIFLDVSGEEGMILDGTTGNEVARFSYGKREGRWRRLWRKLRFGLPGSLDDPSLRFCARTFAVDDINGYLACGAFYDRRVRVLDQSYAVVFEANAEDNPAYPGGGVWRVTRTEFAGHGKYLIVEYQFDGRMTGQLLRPTDIFETATWKRVWQENSLEVDGVTLNHAGDKIAYLLSGALQIDTFVSL